MERHPFPTGNELRRILLLLATTTIAACGGGGDSGGGDIQPPAPDFTVSPFSIGSKTFVAPESLVLSEQVTLQGFDQPLNIHVENGEYCLNQAVDSAQLECVSTDGQVNSGDVLMLRALSSTEAGGSVATTVSIGNDNASVFSTGFLVITKTDSSLPANKATFTTVNGVTPGSTVTSNPVVIDDFNGAISASVSNGAMISVDGAAPVAGPVQLVAGQSIAIVTAIPADATENPVTSLTLSSGENEITSTFEVVLRDDTSTIEVLPPIVSKDAIAPGTEVEFEPITIEGTFAAAPVQISGGAFKINEGEFVTEGDVAPGDVVTVVVQAADAFSRTRHARLTIGEGALATSAEFHVATQDEPAELNRPDPFHFGSELDREPGEELISTPVALTGFSGELPLLVEAGGLTALVSINGDEFGPAPATVTSGSSLRLKVTTPATYATESAVSVHVGNDLNRQSATLAVSTRTQDFQPEPFGFGAFSGLEPGEVKASAAVTINGFEGALPVTIEAPAEADAMVSINGGEFTSSSGSIEAGQTIVVQASASTESAGEHTVRVIVGDLSNGGKAGEFVLTTGDIDPNGFTFDQQASKAEPGEAVLSSVETISGFDFPLPVSIDFAIGTDLVEVAVNGGEFSDDLTGLTIGAGQTLQVRMTASTASSGEAKVILAVGTGESRKTGAFTVNTRDFMPDAFAFDPADVDRGKPEQTYEATTVVGGFEGTLTATVTGTTFSDGSTSKIVSANDSLAINVTAPATIGEAATGAVQLRYALATTPLANATFTVHAADLIPPELTVRYPTATSLTSEESVTVSGTYSDNHAFDGLVVNGKFATLLEGNRWQVSVDLTPGLNTLTATAFDKAANNASAAPLHVTREAERFNRADKVVIAGANTAYVLQDGTDGGVGGIIKVDLETGVQSTFRDGGVYYHMAISDDGADLYVTDWAGIVRINTQNSNESERIYSSPNVGAVIFDTATDDLGTDWERLFFVQHVDTDGVEGVDTDAVYQLDLTTSPPIEKLVSLPGTRGADATDAGGAVFNWTRIWDMAYDSLRDKIYVLDNVNQANDNIFAVSNITDEHEPGSGDRSVLVHAPTNAEGDQYFSNTYGIVLDEAVGKLYVTEILDDRLFLVNVGNGHLDLFTSKAEGSLIRSARDIQLREVSGKQSLIIADALVDRGLIEMTVPLNDADPVTERILPENASIGTGGPIESARTIEHDGGSVAYVTNSKTVRRLDVQSGNRAEALYAIVDEGTEVVSTQLVGDSLWMLQATSSDSYPLGFVDVGQGSANEGTHTNKYTFGDGDGFLGDPVNAFVDGDIAFILTSDDTSHRVYAKDVKNLTPLQPRAEIPSNATSVTGFGELGENLLYFATENAITAVDLASGDFANNHQTVKDGFTEITAVANLDSGRLAVWDDGAGKLVIIDAHDLGNVTQETAIDLADGADPGYDPMNVRDLVYDPNTKHLFGLNSSGTEVINIDLGTVNIDENGTPIEGISGQSLLISRGNDST